MPGDTTRYSFPYQSAGDAPDGPALGQDLAEAVEATVGAIDDRVTGHYAWIAQVRYTAGGAFTKATYPTARKVRVRVQAAGGGGGGAAANASGNVAAGGGGQGGAYAESMLDVSGLASSVTVTVGAAGAANSGAAGGTGGNSSFGTAVTATGGAGGGTSGTGATAFIATGGVSTPTMAGDIQIGGQGGGFGARLGSALGQYIPGVGGSSVLGSGGYGQGNGVPQNGQGYGGGGGGTTTAPSGSARAGGAGAPGIVIVDVYA